MSYTHLCNFATCCVLLASFTLLELMSIGNIALYLWYGWLSPAYYCLSICITSTCLHSHTLYPHLIFDITAFPHLLSLSNPHPHIHRHVMLPKEIAKLVPRGRLMSEKEWRSIGVQQSPGWIHYMIHKPEPHILLFRRPICTRQQMM